MASLINKSNIKQKLRNNQRTESLECSCTHKTNCPFKGKFQFKCIVFKSVVHDVGPNDSNVNRNVKKAYVGSKQSSIKIDTSCDTSK